MTSGEGATTPLFSYTTEPEERQKRGEFNLGGSTDADGILFPPERSLIVTQYKEGVEPVS